MTPGTITGDEAIDAPIIFNAGARHSRCIFRAAAVDVACGRRNAVLVGRRLSSSSHWLGRIMSAFTRKGLGPTEDITYT